jgi:ABC-2 type transport system ATP-binding protein
MIEAEHLCKRFAARVAVDDVSFTVAAGDVVGFLGPNGAGKSTTMRLLTGFLDPDAGQARICGNDIQRDRAAAQACLGYLPEAAGGFPNLTVREVLAFCGESRGLYGARLYAAIERACALIDLAPALDRPMRSLSKGWRQRAWLAQAILHDPPVLILDEPTDGLDPNQKLRVRALIRSVAASKAIILSTHILEEAEEICNRTIIIAAGHIVAQDATQNLADETGRIAASFHRLTAAAATGAEQAT